MKFMIVSCAKNLPSLATCCVHLHNQFCSTFFSDCLIFGHGVIMMDRSVAYQLPTSFARLLKTREGGKLHFGGSLQYSKLAEWRAGFILLSCLLCTFYGGFVFLYLKEFHQTWHWHCITTEFFKSLRFTTICEESSCGESDSVL
jgi:hypothetical protein